MKRFLISMAASALLISQTEACTGIRLKASDGTHVNGRTVEFGIQIDASATVIPRGYPFNADQKSGLQYASKYAVLGASTFTTLAIADGLNEKGLSLGTFYFPGFAGYSKVTPENQSRSLSPIDFPNWILTQFATIDEIKAALPNVLIADTVIQGWGDTPPPFHYVIYDKEGNSLVIEPINGKLVTYDNKLGVFTNSPTFDWHMTNLRNYINLTVFNTKTIDLEGVTLAPFGQGSGMVGMPGDFTPPSRFVRAAIFSATAIPSKTHDDAVFQAFHLLNQFDIPVGSTREISKGVTYTDSTIFTTVKDPQSLKYYFKTYGDQTIRVVDLNQFDLNAKTVKQFGMASNIQPVVDVTKKLVSN